MNYFSTMANILLLKATCIKQNSSLKQLQRHCIINILITGLIYGISASFFSETILVQKGINDGGFSIFRVAMAGIPVVFLLHAGLSLFVWVFFKAIGGSLNFMALYLTIGQASISLWLLAPCVAALQVGYSQLSLMIMTSVLCLYALVVNFMLIRSVSNLSSTKMIIASIISFSYISCFLYIWL